MRKEWSVILPDCVSYLATLIGGLPLLPIEIRAILSGTQLNPAHTAGGPSGPAAKGAPNSIVPFST